MKYAPALRADLESEVNRSLRWPAWKDVLPPGRHGSMREIVKYHTRLLLSLPHRERFLETVSSDPSLDALFTSGPRLFHSPLSRFLDRRFSMSTRFAAAQADLRTALQLIGPRCLKTMARGEDIPLYAPTQAYVLTLGLNEVNPQEGLWSLAIRDRDGTRLSSLSFGFLEDGSVLIGSMQGSRQSGDLALAFAREFTKQAHGLRPPSFLLETLRSMCGVWQIDTILGIDPVNHIKGRWNQRRKRLKFDYRALWREHGAQLDGHGYWRLSTATPPRDLSTVSSNKRSMYRKRFGLLEALRAELLDVLRPSPRAVPASH